MLNLRENDNFAQIILDAEKFAQETDIEFVPLCISRRRKKPKKSGELCKDEPIIDPINKLKIDCFFIVGT